MTRTPKAPAKTGATLEQVAFLAQQIEDAISAANRTRHELQELAPYLPAEQCAQIAQGIAIATRADYLGELVGLGSDSTIDELTQSLPVLVQKLTTGYLGPLVSMAATLGQLSEAISAASATEG